MINYREKLSKNKQWAAEQCRKQMRVFKAHFKKSAAPQLKNNHEMFLYQSSKNNELFNPNLIKTISIVFIVILFLFIVIAAITNINEAAVARGEIVPQKNIINLEHFDGGVVAKIYVSEGDTVKQGDILLTLDGIGAKEDLARFNTKNIALKLQSERLKSIINKTPPDFAKYTADKQLIDEQLRLHQDAIEAARSEKEIISKQLNQQEFVLQSLESKRDFHNEQINIAKQILEMYQKLSVNGHTPKIKLLEQEERLTTLTSEQESIVFDIKKIEKSVQEYKSKLLSYDATQENSMNLQREKIDEEINENNEQIVKLKQKEERRYLRSPVAGIINARYVNDIGESIYPNRKLFEIVPFNTPLIANVHISPSDIGHVKKGDMVWIKVSAFDYIKYGLIKGNLYHISANTFTDEKGGEAYYNGKVRLEQNYVVIKNQKKYLMPGMPIKAEIITGERTILEYLLKPIYRSIEGGLVER